MKLQDIYDSLKLVRLTLWYGSVISMQDSHRACQHLWTVIHINAMCAFSWLFLFPYEHLAYGNLVVILLVFTPLSILQCNVLVYGYIRSLSLKVIRFIVCTKNVTFEMFLLGHFDSYGNFLLVFGDHNHWAEQKQWLNFSSLMIFIIIFSIHAELRIIDTSSLSHKIFWIKLSML